ncbi:unnamed protein product [Clavelina lepadiformis]|uniref:Metalloendopeptidase n=1 Tax=Clavelina lepadiformis TaxID=159417 RepID=A0ABP0GVH8_CLALP
MNTSGAAMGKRTTPEEGNPIGLSNGCYNVPIVFHELMHALGFFHEQARPDHDEHVKILWENVKEGGLVIFPFSV